jgi:hypothetical protein
MVHLATKSTKQATLKARAVCGPHRLLEGHLVKEHRGQGTRFLPVMPAGDARK